MIYIQEIDLLNLGILYGIIGDICPSKEQELFSLLDHSNCSCVLFCFRILEDRHLADALVRYVRSRKQIRLVLIHNEIEAQQAPLSVQKALDDLYPQVDMILLSTWPIEDLPLCVAIHSDATILLDSHRETDLAARISIEGYSRVIKL